ncbi:hypothetical protein AB0M39_30945 [Streptomyces sp. NPDC051907]|uniref:hypothetical protein n=1 Tax=Streptomyces sp. NPDC051907 TaxID=3155284 RepID=UPI0034193441
MSQTPHVRPADSLEPAGPAAGSSSRRRSGRSSAERGVRRWPVILLRCLITAFLVLTLVQPVLAGMFVTGEVDLLELHEINAHTISFLSWLLVVSAVLLWRPGRGPLWPIPVALLLSVLVQMQSGWGFSRALELHIPVGVALTAGATALAYWAFSYRGGRR